MYIYFFFLFRKIYIHLYTSLKPTQMLIRQVSQPRNRQNEFPENENADQKAKSTPLQRDRRLACYDTLHIIA